MDLLVTEILAEDRIVENTQFKAGTRITNNASDGALIEAQLNERTTVSGIEFGAGTLLSFAGNKHGELVKAVVVGEHDVQGVVLSAGEHEITLEFSRSAHQLRSAVKSATSSGVPLIGNDMAFKAEVPLVFYRPGHIGAGDLHSEVLLDGIWFGPRAESEEPAEVIDDQSWGRAVRVKITVPPPAIGCDFGDIGFYPNGRGAYGTLSRRQNVNGLLLEDNTPVSFYKGGQLLSGTLAEETVIDGIRCNGTFQLREDGGLFSGTFAEETEYDGIRCTGQFRLYDDGKLLGGTLVGRQTLGEVICEGHFSLHPNGMPNRVYMGVDDEQKGHPYNKGWLLRFGSNGGLAGFQASSPGYWVHESIDDLCDRWIDFGRYYASHATVCENAECKCHRFDAIDPYTFTSEIRNYMQKGWALMNHQRLAEAAAVQEKALELSIKYSHIFGGDMVHELCRDIARRQVSEGHLDDALVMLDQAQHYLHRYWKERPSYQVEQCRLAYAKCQILWQQKKFAELESAVTPLVAICEGDTTQWRSHSLQYYEYSNAEKMLGDCCVERNDFAGAEVHYEKALSANQYEYLRVDVLRAYHALLVRTEQIERAAAMAVRIQQIEQQPPHVMQCGTGAMQELMWLNWQPTLQLD